MELIESVFFREELQSELFEELRECFDLPEDSELSPAAALSSETMGKLSSSSQLHLKNSPRVELYGLHGLPFTYFKSLVNQNLKTSSIRSRGSSEVPIAMKVFG